MAVFQELIDRTPYEKDQFINSNPIGDITFDWIPRYLMKRKDIPATAKLILAVMHGSLAKDCKVTFRIATLAKRTGLSEPTVKRAIKKGRDLGLFVTIQTGRGLKFGLLKQDELIPIENEKIKKRKYNDYLKDPKWQKKRLEIFNRDNWACQLCGNSDKTLSIHHKKYQKNFKPWEYDNDDLITLCSDCHTKFHG